MEGGESMKKFDDNIVINLSREERDQFIRDYQPFVLSVISKLKNGYVSAANEEFSIGLMAFNEAIDKYQINKGSFLSFARLVIESRVKNYWKKESGQENLSLEEYLQFEKVSVNSDLKIEILSFEEVLSDFGLTFEDLVEKRPKHQKSRDNAIRIGHESSKDKEITDALYQKKRLPISLISRKLTVTLKILKRNKLFITSVIIVFKEKYDEIIKFIM